MLHLLGQDIDEVFAEVIQEAQEDQETVVVVKQE